MISDDSPGGCLPSQLPLGALDDPEGERVPDGLAVIDAHVHLFPPKLFDAIWRWFDAHAWPIRYRLYAEATIEFLLSRGVERFAALHYAHKPGIAASLNKFVYELSLSHPEIIPLATVFPGEPDTVAILRDALGRKSMRGVKLHCHVQRMPADDPRMEPVWRECESAGVPVVIHAGREPSSPAYGIDTRALCAATQIERVLQRHPRLTLVVPHLGADEWTAYARLLDRYDKLWLDTTMAITGYFSSPPPSHLWPAKASRILYGTDFPNLPYAWDRELNAIVNTVSDSALRHAVLYANARTVFAL